MRLLALAVLLSGCFVVTRATYAALVHPDPAPLPTDPFACSVAEEGDELQALVGMKFEHGQPQAYDLGGLRGRRFASDLERLEGRRFDGFRHGSIPCVLVESDSKVALGEVAWHFDGEGRREPRATPITPADLESAAFRSGRDGGFDSDDCMACQNFSTGPGGTDLALPTYASPGGIAGFTLLVPLTVVIDLAAALEVSIICGGNSACFDAFMRVK